MFMARQTFLFQRIKKIVFHLYSPWTLCPCCELSVSNFIVIGFCRDVLSITHSFTGTMGLCVNNQPQGNYLIHDAVVHKGRCLRFN